MKLVNVISLTFLSLSAAAIARLSKAVNVLFPTPPLPESTNTLFLTWSNRSLTSCIPGSGPLVAPDEHICWFGQPAQADALPASSLWVPGQSANI